MRTAVVVPAFRAEQFLAATLDSVRAQTVDDWALVVVDDGSPDGTAEVAAAHAGQDPRIRLVRQDNAGVAAARNAGLAAVGADATEVVFLDADDCWRPGTLAALRAGLAAAPDAPAAHGLAAGMDAHGDPEPLTGRERLGRRVLDDPGRWPRPRPGLRPLDEAAPTGFAALVVGSPVTTPGQVLFRRAALERVGGFDPAVVPAEDWDLLLRVARLGSLAHVPQVVLDYRQHAGGASKQLSTMRRGELAVRHKLLAAPGLTQDQRALVRQSFLRVEWERAGERLARARRDVTGRRDVRGGARNLARAGASALECVRAVVGR